METKKNLPNDIGYRDRQICDRYQNGERISDLAKTYGVSGSTIRATLKKLGVIVGKVRDRKIKAPPRRPKTVWLTEDAISYLKEFSSISSGIETCLMYAKKNKLEINNGSE